MKELKKIHYYHHCVITKSRTVKDHFVWFNMQMNHKPIWGQIYQIYQLIRASLISSFGKESTWNAGNPGLILGSGRSAGKGIGYPIQNFWASLVVQLMHWTLGISLQWICLQWGETWVQSLGWEDPREKGKATHYSGLENSTDCIVHGVTKSWTQLSTFHFSFTTSLERFCWDLRGGDHGEGPAELGKFQIR